jgi:cysteine desulfuration protein SufE
MTLDDVIETFEALGDDWEERFRYIISLGKNLHGLPEADKTEANRVHGCQSQAWLVAKVLPGQPPRLELAADADAFIVRGLVAILLLAFSGKTAPEILKFDVDELFTRLDLIRQLTPARSNGLFAMVKKIKTLAVAA